MVGVTPARVGEACSDCKELEVFDPAFGVIEESLRTFGNRGTKTFLFWCKSDKIEGN